MKVKITADSTCDLSQELLDKYGISLIPLYVVKGEESLRDGIEIVPQDIYDYVEKGGVCKTSAVNVAEYTAIFSEYKQGYDALIHINISSEFSACYQNAQLAATELENVYVVDSRNLSTGSGHLVIDAAIMAAQGMAPADIVTALNRLAEKVEASFVIDTLKYLHRGGRCSAVTALGANLLKLKPCIEVINGKMEVGKKYRGNIEKVIQQYITDRLIEREDIDYKRIFITTTGSDEMANAAAEQVKQLGPWEDVIITKAGCTVSNHCGPNTLGILFYRK